MALTAQQILFIHARLIAETGGTHGVRDLGLLESAVALPFATFDQNDLYPDLFSKAAALMQSLVKNRPFVDGNTRTAFAATGIFLSQRGYVLQAETGEVVAFVLQVATGKVSIETMSRWLESHVRKDRT